MVPAHFSRLPISRILLVSGLALCGSVLRADIIASNFCPNANQSVCLSGTYDDNAGVPVENGGVETYIAIELPALTSSYDLTSIEFVASTQNTPDPSNSVTVGIYADNGGVPAATSLESLTLTGSLALFDGSLSPVLTATSVGNPQLSLGTRYWLVMNGPASESLIWDTNASGDASGYSSGTGSPLSWTVTSNTNGVYEVDGTVLAAPAPEPGTWILLAGGLGLMTVLARRRSRNAA